MFERQARRHFDSIAARFGMTSVASIDRQVRYQNDRAFLVIHYDTGRSYELGVELGRAPGIAPERPFSLSEVLRLKGVADAATVDGMMIRDPALLATSLERLATLVALHTGDFLSANEFSFAQLARQREREGTAFSAQRDLRVARRASNAAWAIRDYKSIVAALEPLEAHLSPAEKKRLNFARKHRDAG